jgi:ABC-type Fe3+-hydroxamate transport system substrate-binding protein
MQGARDRDALARVLRRWMRTARFFSADPGRRAGVAGTSSYGSRMALRIEDDRRRELFLFRPPQRLVSLVPSETHALFALGLGSRVVGRTRYCVEPADQIAGVPVCGGTKDIDVDAVCALAPELVLANQEENQRAALEELGRRGIPVFVSFPRRVAEGIAHLARLARICGVDKEPAARDLVRRAYALLAAPPPDRRVSVFVPIWMEPLMTFSADTYASDLLALAGADNVFAGRQRRYPLAADLGERPPWPEQRVGDRDTRYPRVTLGELVERAPELVLLPDEPHAFSPADAAVFAAQDLPAARHGRITNCSGKDLFWYGAWVIEALPRLRALVTQLGRGD